MNTKNTKAQSVRFMLKNVKIQFPHLAEAFAFEPGEKPTFSGVFTFANDDRENKRAVWDSALQAATGLWGADYADKLLRNRQPVKSGEKFGPGLLALKAKTQFPPTVCDQRRQRMAVNEISEYIRGGATVNVVLEAHPYSHAGNEGVGFYLTAVQLVKESDWKAEAANEDLTGLFSDVPAAADVDPF